MSESPFTDGLSVFVVDRYGDWRNATIAKVHKSGRFTLAGDAQQFRPFSYGGAFGGQPVTWSARETGESWYKRRVHLVTDETIKEYQDAKRRQRRDQIIHELERSIRTPQRVSPIFADKIVSIVMGMAFEQLATPENTP